MMISRRQFTRGALAAGVCARAYSARREAKIRVLVIDGINNHTWQLASAAICEILANTGMFTTEISTTPPADAGPELWEAWRPDCSRYDVVISNFNSGHDAKAVLWPAPVREAIVKYVREGGGFVSYHAANNAFLLWPEYNEMIGMGWRPKCFGPSVHIGGHDEVVVTPKGEGNDPNHPRRLDFPLHVRNTHHPITEGMPPTWMHPSEQLTHGQHGPVEGFTYLTYAHSPVTLQNEPMDWVRSYGKGRVYVTMLGHTWANEKSPDLECIGFQTLLARGVQWAAQGRVSIPVPKNFPGPDRISLRPLKCVAAADRPGEA